MFELLLRWLIVAKINCFKTFINFISILSVIRKYTVVQTFEVSNQFENSCKMYDFKCFIMYNSDAYSFC
jgi:hypothetical protein